MKQSSLYAGILFSCFALASCHSNSTSTTSTTDSTANNTAVTTTTTRVYSGSFRPQADMKYMDLKTQKQVSVRIDTTTGMLVNAETSEPMDLFVAGTDTIYGQTGNVANNYITRDESGNYSVDQSRMNGGSDISSTSATSTDNAGTSTSATDNSGAAADDATTTGRAKYKQKANGDTKLKTDDEKIKDKNGVEKVKER